MEPQEHAGHGPRSCCRVSWGSAGSRVCPTARRGGRRSARRSTDAGARCGSGRACMRRRRRSAGGARTSRVGTWGRGRDSPRRDGSRTGTPPPHTGDRAERATATPGSRTLGTASTRTSWRATSAASSGGRRRVRVVVDHEQGLELVRPRVASEVVEQRHDVLEIALRIDRDDDGRVGCGPGSALGCRHATDAPRRRRSGLRVVRPVFPACGAGASTMVDDGHRGAGCRSEPASSSRNTRKAGRSRPDRSRSPT